MTHQEHYLYDLDLVRGHARSLRNHRHGHYSDLLHLQVGSCTTFVISMGLYHPEFIHLVCLVALLVSSGKAPKKLRENGIKTGLRGARMSDF